MIKIRLPWDHLIFIIEIPILVPWHHHIEMGPWLVLMCVVYIHMTFSWWYWLIILYWYWLVIIDVSFKQTGFFCILRILDGHYHGDRLVLLNPLIIWSTFCFQATHSRCSIQRNHTIEWSLILRCHMYCGNDKYRIHDDVIKWKHSPHYWPFVRGIHRSLMDSPHKGQWHGALMFSLICTWMNGWANNWNASDLRCHGAH